MTPPSCSVGGLLRVLVTFVGHQNSKMWQIQISKISSTCKTLENYCCLHLVLGSPTMADITVSSIELESHTHPDEYDQYTLSSNIRLKSALITPSDRKRHALQKHPKP